MMMMHAQLSAETSEVLAQLRVGRVVQNLLQTQNISVETAQHRPLLAALATL